MALQYHPDRQADESSKKRASQLFVKISNAYEIVGDENRRREYDLEQQQEQIRKEQRRRYDASTHHHPFHFSFHDPMEVFAQAFAEEFGTQSRRGMDPFFGSSMFGGGSLFGRGGFGSFDNDPFFSDPFGRRMGGGMDMFSQMQRQMDMLHQQQRSQGFSNNGGFSSSSYHSSSSFSGGNRESVSTTTRIINGKRQTITERVVTKPDGTVERHVETQGDDDFPAVEQPQLENERKRAHKQIEGRKSRRNRHGPGH